MSELEEALVQGCAHLNLPLSDSVLSDFRRYYDFLTERNRIMDLTAIAGEKDTAELHFLDSLSIAGLFDLNSKRVIDIGSGAGFPGLPLQLAVPSMKLTLLDSQEKRVQFLTELCGLLDLHGVDIIHMRAEDAAKNRALREQFDAALSRAVAELNVLCELCLPFVAPGGAFIAMKSVKSDGEITEAATAIKLLGGALESTRDYNIPGTDIWHRFVFIRKVNPTPDIYPRRFAKIQKSPL